MPVNAPLPGRRQGRAMSAALMELDARGLEPPQPMIRILEALADLPPETELRVQTDRRPIHLYPALAERGFEAETTEAEDHGYVTRIRRRG